MEKEIEPLVEEVSWGEVSGVVSKTCKKLADIINDISPKYPLIKVRYPFGMKILENAIFHLPYDLKTSVPITDSRIPSATRNKLIYSSFPLGIVVKNNVEIFRDLEDKIFSLAFYGNGLDLGIWEHFGWSTPYSITAGARSLYMLPKISEASSHKQLKKLFGVTAPPPRRLYDHWQIFTQITNSQSFSTPWFCEIIFLTDKWVENIKNNKLWYELKSYIDDKGWQHSGYSRRKSLLDISWEIFARSLNHKELRADPHIIDTLKHLVFIGTSTVPALAPFTGSEEAGPLKEIQSIYENAQGYGLKGYVPTIMQPCTFSIENQRPVYYSLHVPTLLETVPRSKKATSTMDSVRELHEILKQFLDMNMGSDLQIPHNVFGDILNKSKFDFFHGEMFAYGQDIRPSTEMPKDDSSLIYDPQNTGQNERVFASNSTFLRGCVRISIKDKEKHK